MFEYVSTLGQWFLVLGQWVLGGIGVAIFVLLLGNGVKETRRRSCKRKQRDETCEPDRRYTMKCYFRVTPEDFAKVKSAAKAKGMTLSAFLRQRVFRETTSFIAVAIPEDPELVPGDKKKSSMH